MMRIKELCMKYKHAAFLIYYPIVVLLFQALEMRNTSVSNWIWSPIDYKIPFVGAFVIPYMLWFLFMAACPSRFWAFATSRNILSSSPLFISG